LEKKYATLKKKYILFDNYGILFSFSKNKKPHAEAISG
jgi:hypothetical protein